MSATSAKPEPRFLPASALRRHILESLGDGVLSVDTNMRITSMNAAAERLLGLPRHRVVGRRCSEVIQADRCQRSCPMRHTLTTGEVQRDEPVTVRYRNARELPVCVSTDLLRDEEGRPIGAVELIRASEAEEPSTARSPWGSPEPPTRYRRPSTRAIMEARIEPDERLNGSLEAQRLAEVLQAHGWRREDTAQALGISRSTLWRRMKALGLLD
jgi:PAS domain S-box-containing protein